MLTLGAKIKVDHSELGQAENRLNHFAEHFERHFMRHFSKAFGSLALIGGVFKLVEGIFEKPEKIEEAAKKTGLWTDEVQLLTKAAEEMGMTFDELLERANKGTVDLIAVLGEMRKKMPRIIQKEDIDELVEDKKMVKKVFDGIQDFLIAEAAGKIRLAKSAAKMLTKAPSWSAFSPEVYGPPAPTKQEGGAFGVGMPFSFGPLGLFSQMFSPGMTRIAALGQVNNEILSLQSQMKAFRNIAPRELIAPELTGRQQVGAYSSGRSIWIDKISEQTDALHHMEDQLENLEQIKRRLESI